MIGSIRHYGYIGPATSREDDGSFWYEESEILYVISISLDKEFMLMLFWVDLILVEHFAERFTLFSLKTMTTFESESCINTTGIFWRVALR